MDDESNLTELAQKNMKLNGFGLTQVGGLPDCLGLVNSLSLCVRESSCLIVLFYKNNNLRIVIKVTMVEMFSKPREAMLWSSQTQKFWDYSATLV